MEEAKAGQQGHNFASSSVVIIEGKNTPYLQADSVIIERQLVAPVAVQGVLNLLILSFSRPTSHTHIHAGLSVVHEQRW